MDSRRQRNSAIGPEIVMVRPTPMIGVDGDCHIGERPLFLFPGSCPQAFGSCKSCGLTTGLCGFDDASTRDTTALRHVDFRLTLPTDSNQKGSPPWDMGKLSRVFVLRTIAKPNKQSICVTLSQPTLSLRNLRM